MKIVTTEHGTTLTVNARELDDISSQTTEFLKDNCSYSCFTDEPMPNEDMTMETYHKEMAKRGFLHFKISENIKVVVDLETKTNQEVSHVDVKPLF